MTEQKLCPCGSGVAFSACCGRYINQSESAPGAESLMRSRYSAYVRCDETYLLQTWHSSTRPMCIELDDGAIDGMQWLSLEILSTTAGRADDKKGTVEFIARYRLNGRLETLHETSRFLQQEGRWYYLDGEIHSTDNSAKKTGRNAACRCGSGKKYKRCCGR